MNVITGTRAAPLYLLDHKVTLRMQTTQDETEFKNFWVSEEFLEENSQTHTLYCPPLGICMSKKYTSISFKSLIIKFLLLLAVA